MAQTIIQTVLAVLIGGSIIALLQMWRRQSVYDEYLKKVDELERRVTALSGIETLVKSANEKLDELLEK